MHTTFREKISDTVLILKESLLSFQKNNNLERSAAFSYYGFFALIPLLLLVIYVIGNFILSLQAAVKAVEAFTSQLFPEVSKIITKELYSLSIHKGIWGTLSIITLFWSITPLASAMRNTFIRIFKEEGKTPFFKAKLRDVVAVLVLLVLFISFVISELFYSMFIKTYFKTHLLLDIVTFATPLIITVLLITVFYRAFSPVKVKIIHLLAGAIAAAVLWTVMKPVFSLFMKFNPNYGYTFGSLKAIFILFVWVYYSFAAILFGGEVIANVRKKDALMLRGLFFSDAPLSKKARGRITKKFVKEYSKNDEVFREGEKGDTMFCVLSGSVSILKHGQVLKVMKAGDYFGEMSMLLDSPRTATVVVNENGTQLVAISQNNFEIILKEEPHVLLSLLKEIAQRLKTTDGYL